MGTLFACPRRATGSPQGKPSTAVPRTRAQILRSLAARRRWRVSVREIIRILRLRRDWAATGLFLNTRAGLFRHLHRVGGVLRHLHRVGGVLRLRRQ
jgi:hypothetical protein